MLCVAGDAYNLRRLLYEKEAICYASSTTLTTCIIRIMSSHTLTHVDKAAQLNAIVGAAIKAMAEAGATPERLGAFAAEFRTHVAGVMGGEPRVDEPDLLGLVKMAVREVIGETSSATQPVQPTLVTGAASAAGVRRVYVSISGKRTSVSIPESVYETLSKTVGGSPRVIKRRIEAVAQEVPIEVENRSAWITERLRTMALANLPETAFGQRH